MERTLDLILPTDQAPHQPNHHSWGDWDYLGTGPLVADATTYVSSPTSIRLTPTGNKTYYRVARFKPEPIHIFEGRLIDYIRRSTASGTYAAYMGWGFWLQNELGYQNLPQGYYLEMCNGQACLWLQQGQERIGIASSPYLFDCYNVWRQCRITWLFTGPPELGSPLRLTLDLKNGTWVQKWLYDIYNPAFINSPTKKVGIYFFSYSTSYLSGNIYHDDTEIWTP